MVHRRLTKKQNRFLEAFEKHATNISRACKSVGIERQTHYDWKSRNLTYKAKIEAIEESMIDFAESVLYKNMKDGKEQSILFFLKTRGRKRGYIEKQEITQETKVSYESQTLKDIQDNMKE
jgi:hypothetical protein